MAKLFGTDGIRAIAGTYPLDRETVSNIAYTSAHILKDESKELVIGWDTRESSEQIAQTVIEQYVKVGYTVYIVGVFPTPGVAYISLKNKRLGIVISASHNPYEYNGIKFISSLGGKLPDSLELAIENAVLQKVQFPETNIQGAVVEYMKEAEEEYVHFLSQVYKEESLVTPFILDCANGSTSHISTVLFAKLFPFCRVFNNLPTGKNINERCGAVHPEYARDQKHADEFCITFDGDGDRIILVDEDGVIRDGDFILAILSQYYKEQGLLTQPVIVPTIMSNIGLVHFLEKQGIKTVLSPVGDKHVFEELERFGGVLGGETSGHIIMKDLLPMGDGLLVALRLLSIMKKSGRKLSELANVFQPYPQIIKNIQVNSRPDIQKVFDTLVLQQYEQEIDGRILIRYSGTEPVLRILVEGKSMIDVEHVVDKLVVMFQSYKKE